MFFFFFLQLWQQIFSVPPSDEALSLAITVSLLQDCGRNVLILLSSSLTPNSENLNLLPPKINYAQGDVLKTNQINNSSTENSSVSFCLLEKDLKYLMQAAKPHLIRPLSFCLTSSLPRLSLTASEVPWPSCCSLVAYVCLNHSVCREDGRVVGWQRGKEGPRSSQKQEGTLRRGLSAPSVGLLASSLRKVESRSRLLSGGPPADSPLRRTTLAALGTD